MIYLAQDEKILMVVRKHWYALFRHSAILLALALAPAFFYAFYGKIAVFIVQTDLLPLVNFLFSIYMLSLILYGFIVWADYYLDVWIITNKRLVDIEQRGLFSRTISELPMAKIQNVTIEIPGFIATALRFGNLRVETASQSTFVISDAPRLYEAKDLILKQAHQQNSEVKNPETKTEVAN